MKKLSESIKCMKEIEHLTIGLGIFIPLYVSFV